MPTLDQTGQSGGEASGGFAGEDAELRRQFRELLFRQPDDRGLLLRVSRPLMPKKTAGSSPEELQERMRAVLDGLGDQLLPPETP